MNLDISEAGRHGAFRLAPSEHDGAEGERHLEGDLNDSGEHRDRDGGAVGITGERATAMLASRAPNRPGRTKARIETVLATA